MLVWRPMLFPGGAQISSFVNLVLLIYLVYKTNFNWYSLSYCIANLA